MKLTDKLKTIIETAIKAIKGDIKPENMPEKNLEIFLQI
jgi:hypothetical protein